MLPTSITIAPSLRSLPEINPGLPTALTTTSKSFNWLTISLVRECINVTVAFSLVSNLATGCPTMCERPTTATVLPSSDPVCFNNSIIPSGVHGTNVR